MCKRAEVEQQLGQGGCFGGFGQALHPVCDWVEDLAREPLIAPLQVEAVGCLGLEGTIAGGACKGFFYLQESAIVHIWSWC